MLFLLLSGAIFGACSSDKDRVPVFVKNVVMPPDSWVFAPGDGVTVSAEGFEADDEIMLEIHWQESAEGFAPEGYAKGRARDRHGAFRHERHLSGPGGTTPLRRFGCCCSVAAG